MPTRTVTLALVDPAGEPLGTLALPGSTPTPHWQETHEVVTLARAACGIDVTVLRLLSVRPGNAVTYVAEYAGPPPAGLDRSAASTQWTAPHPLRMPWADPGGPAASLRWADAELARLGVTVTGRMQQRTWNLSSIWRLDTDHGRVWLKEVPPFFAHEGPLLRLLHRPALPVVLATGGGRTLLADIPGTDRYRAGVPERVPMLAALLDIQTDVLDRVDELRAAGVPDARASVFVARARELAETLRMSELDDLVDDLPVLFAEMAACGVPDTLVHGDFHPGNVRSDGGAPVLLDWGDSVAGQPGLDLLRLAEWPPVDTGVLRDAWCAHWRRVVPGCAPERVLDLLGPVAPLRAAVSYRHFVESIEPAERGYHEQDVITAAYAAVERHQKYKQTVRSRSILDE